MTRAGLKLVFLLLTLATLSGLQGLAQDASVSIEGMTVARNSTNNVRIMLVSTGNVNGLGFSLKYDTNLLTFLKTTTTNDALSTEDGSASVNKNTDLTNVGMVGFAMVLPINEIYPEGSNYVLRVHFRVAPGIGTTLTPITFAPTPITNQVIMIVDGVVTNATRTFTYNPVMVRVQGVCSYTLSAHDASYPGAGGNGQLDVFTSSNTCPWTVGNTNDWIHFSDETGAGDMSLSYAVDENTSPGGRTGWVQIADQFLVVTQEGVPCMYELSAPGGVYGFGATSDFITLTTGGDCPWMVVITNDWIHPTSDITGNGIAGISFDIDENPFFIERTGTVVVADQVFTVTQHALVCSYALVPDSREMGYSVGGESVDLVTPGVCFWDVINTNDWISITSSTNGNLGGGTVTFTVTENPTSLGRTGWVEVADQWLMVSQLGAPCNYGFDTSSLGVSPEGTNASVAVTATTGCFWLVSKTNSWINITSALSNYNSGLLTFSVVSNDTGLARSGNINVQGLLYPITQDPAPCAYGLALTSQSVGPEGTNGTVAVSATSGCSWLVSKTNTWITITSASSNYNGGIIGYTVASNDTVFVRSGNINVQGMLYLITQGPSACGYSLSSSNKSVGPGISNVSVTVNATTGCSWLVSNSNSWINITSALSNYSGGTLSFTVASNDTAISRSGNIDVQGILYSVTQGPAPCAYSLSVSNKTVGPEETNGTVAVTTTSGCSWLVAKSNSWITITSAISNYNSGTLTYNVASNDTALTRSGNISVQGILYLVTQGPAPCAYSLASSNKSVGPTATNGSVAVTTTTGCSWLVSKTNTWISITSAASNYNSGTLNFTVASNDTVFSRSGNINVQGLLYSITQSASSCGYSLAASNKSVGPGISNVSVTVNATTGCSWLVANSNTWINITSALSNYSSGTLSFTVASNDTAISRSGNIDVQGILYTVTQGPAPCAYSLSVSNKTVGPDATNGSVTVNATTGCSWLVSKSNTWITITSASSNYNSGTLTYNVASNDTALTRSGNINIQGILYLVTQGPAPCAYSLASSNNTVGPLSTNGSVAVTATTGCSWLVSKTNTWITITSAASNYNSGTLTYTVASNDTALTRSGNINAQGILYLVTQGPAPCAYSLASSNKAVGPTATNGTVAVTATTGCTWLVSKTNPWINITSPLSNYNSGTLTYTVDSNDTALARSGNINVQGILYLVTQGAASCAYNLAVSNASVGFEGTNGSVAVNATTGCSWLVSKSNTWITITSASSNYSSGTLSYTVASNDTALSRSGNINVQGIPYLITQGPAPCAYNLASSSKTVGPGATNGSVAVTVTTGCSWLVSKTNSWIAITSASSNFNSGTLSFTVASNDTFLARSGNISVQGVLYSITQDPTPCTYVLSTNSIVHDYVAITNSFGVTANSNCVWAVSATTPSWITINSGPQSFGTGVVTYALSANLSPTGRTGQVLVANQALVVSQRGATNGFKVDWISLLNGNQVELRLTGAPGGVWALEASTDLSHWSKIADITNLTGTVQYSGTATNLQYRFFRATQP